MIANQGVFHCILCSYSWFLDPRSLFEQVLSWLAAGCWEQSFKIIFTGTMTVMQCQPGKQSWLCFLVIRVGWQISTLYRPLSLKLWLPMLVPTSFFAVTSCLGALMSRPWLRRRPWQKTWLGQMPCSRNTRRERYLKLRLLTCLIMWYPITVNERTQFIQNCLGGLTSSSLYTDRCRGVDLVFWLLVCWIFVWREVIELHYGRLRHC